MNQKIKLTKDNILISLIVILSSILNFTNLNIENYSNEYYAAAVKSMTLSLKNFFFVSFDPAGFVSVDKPPLGFWLQTISAKIFGYNAWSILLPQALAGVISVILIYVIVKRSFGSIAGLISALCLSITPVFVAVSRNNTIDNTLVMFLLFACLALTIAAEKGKLKYLIISMICVGLGFNVKMLQAYMVVPALYITYLLATSISFTKRIGHLIIGTVILIIVSLSWAVIVDLVPSNNRPFVDSSTNNTVTELILGHNGSERISFSSKKSKQGGAPNGGHVDKGGAGQNNNSSNPIQNNKSVSNSGNGPQANGRQMGGGPSKASGPQSSGSLQEQTTQGITRLFSKNVLSDQIVWFIPLAIFGMFAAFFKEKVGLKLDNKRKQSLILWSVWFVPVFLYFSFNTGTSHPYYLTMLAPPTAALAGIGITAMWTFYKEGGWKSWLLPIALLANGAAQLLMLYYFISYSSIVKVLMVLLIILCFVSSIVLSILNLVKNKNDDNVIRLKKILVGAAFLGLLLTPFVGSSTVIFTKVNGSFPAAGLELLSGSSRNDGMSNISSSSKLIEFLEKNNTTEKYLLVVSTSGDASNIIIKTGKPVMTLGGFGGSDNIISLNKFKQMVKNGEVRYVMVSSSRSMNNQNSSENSNSAIMSWAQKNGTLVSTSKYSNVDQTNNNSNSMTPKMGMSGQLYDLKTYTDSNNTK